MTKNPMREALEAAVKLLRDRLDNLDGMDCGYATGENTWTDEGTMDFSDCFDAIDLIDAALATQSVLSLDVMSVAHTFTDRGFVPKIISGEPQSGERKDDTTAEEFLARAYESVGLGKSAYVIRGGGELSGVQQGLACMAINMALASQPCRPTPTMTPMSDEDALRKCGHHLSSCIIHGNGYSAPCDCGFIAAIQSASQGKKP